jgi:hypothetical protein
MEFADEQLGEDASGGEDTQAAVGGVCVCVLCVCVLSETLECLDSILVPLQVLALACLV